MSDTATQFELPDLCDQAEVTVRTVRYYIAQGLLPSPGQTGPGARYGQGHLDRLRLIRKLQREHLPLAEIRRRLEVLSDDEVAALLGDVMPASKPGSALDYVRTKPVPFPPEPLRWGVVELTQRAMTYADSHGGARNAWLRTLDRLGVGFDS